MESIKKVMFWFIKPKIYNPLDTIRMLKNNPDNYGKVSMMYLKLQNIHALTIGKGLDDDWNFFFIDFYGKQYNLYRDLYFEYKLKNVRYEKRIY